MDKLFHFILVCFISMDSISCIEDFGRSNYLDTKVSKEGELYVLLINSAVYNLTEVSIELEKDKDDLIFDSEAHISVKNPNSSIIEAFGYLKYERFFGQFQIQNRTFILDEVPNTLEAHISSLKDVQKKFGIINESFDKEVEFEKDESGPQAYTSRVKTYGNYCTVRIIVDKFVLKLFGNDKQRMKSVIKMHEFTLNDVYKLNNVRVRNEQLKFAVVDIVFQDESYCRRHSNAGLLPFYFYFVHSLNFLTTVGCKSWRSDQDQELLDTIGKTDYSDVCLTFLFTSHKFGGTLGNFAMESDIPSKYPDCCFRNCLQRHFV